MTKAIQTLDPPEALRPWITGFVLRDEPGKGQVVRLLPEPRPSIQIVFGDPYWHRSSTHGAPWTRVPGIGLWGPRYGWAFGWPEGHIRIFGFGLTPAGLRALTGGPGGAMLDRVVALDRMAPALAQALEALPTEEFSRMASFAARALTAAFRGCDAHDPISAAALDCLATQCGGAVAQAAALCAMSERQFRRVFQEYNGATPKLYQRVRRIDRMLRALHPQPWETDALKDHETGFADQPHLIREFQALTGLTPERYARAVKRVGGPVLRSVPEAGIAPPDVRR